MQGAFASERSAALSALRECEYQTIALDLKLSQRRYIATDRTLRSTTELNKTVTTPQKSTFKKFNILRK
jgi:hypothetical protein